MRCESLDYSGDGDGGGQRVVGLGGLANPFPHGINPIFLFPFISRLGPRGGLCGVCVCGRQQKSPGENIFFLAKENQQKQTARDRLSYLRPYTITR